MKLEKVVPWGRSKREYFGMFNLCDYTSRRPILGCGDGPASFNAEMLNEGERVISCDPVYQFSAAEIRSQFFAVKDGIINQMKATPQKWVWKFHSGLDDLVASRIETIDRFADDFEKGKSDGRYIVAELPTLPFPDKEFGLALCSHLLFLYSDHLAEDFHVKSVAELCRVAEEVRVFPILTLEQKVSPHLVAVLDCVRELGYTAEILEVDYEQQVGGNQMLKIKKRT